MDNLTRAKSISTNFLTLAFIFSFSFTAMAQMPILDICGDVNMGNDRRMVNLINANNGSHSQAILTLTAGTGTNETFGNIASISQSYNPLAGYAGYTIFNNDNSGLILRSRATGSDIKFLVGGNDATIDQKLIIKDTGNVGIGTSVPNSKLQVADGDIYIEDINNGVIMRSPNGSCWRLTIDNSGMTNTTLIVCP